MNLPPLPAHAIDRRLIADSLAKVESDLSKAKGPKTVVLVTDGEETCDGDPGAVIQARIDKGFDFRLNIIGFALDDEMLEAQFAEWAEPGGRGIPQRRECRWMRGNGSWCSGTRPAGRTISRSALTGSKRHRLSST